MNNSLINTYKSLSAGVKDLIHIGLITTLLYSTQSAYRFTKDESENLKEKNLVGNFNKDEIPDTLKIKEIYSDGELVKKLSAKISYNNTFNETILGEIPKEEEVGLIDPERDGIDAIMRKKDDKITKKTETYLSSYNEELKRFGPFFQSKLYYLK